jgi:hypothetical protein
MTRKTLEDMEAVVNAACRDTLTHAITINGKTVRVQGDYGDGQIAAAGSVSTRQEIELMILKADWPAYPVKSDVYLLPKLLGLRFKPANAENAPDGAHWIVNVVKLGI